MASALLWQITQHNNSFLVKRNGYRFSSHPSNITNKSNAKFDGISNTATVNVIVQDNQVALLRRDKDSKKATTSVVPEAKRYKAGRKAVLASLQASGRADQSKAAAARYARVYNILHNKTYRPKKFISKRNKNKKLAQ